MGQFNVSLTLTGIETGRSETLDAVVDRNVAHSIIPADTLARLGITPTGRSHPFPATKDGKITDAAARLPSGSAIVALRDLVDYCEVAPILFGPAGCQAILGRTTLDFMDLTVAPDGQRLVPAPIRVPGDAIVSALAAAGRRADPPRLPLLDIAGSL